MLKVPSVVVGVCLDGGGVGRLRPGALGARVLVLGCPGVGGGVLGGVVVVGVGGGGVGGGGGGLAVWLQQGPVHVGSFLLMLMLLQRRCNQSPQPVQRTEFDVTFFEHIGQK